MALKGKLLDTGVKPLLTLAASENKEKEQCQRAKKVVSDSPGLADFAFGLVKSVFKLARWASDVL